MATSRTIPIAIIIGGIIIAGAVYFSISQNKPYTGSGKGNPSLVRPIDTQDHIFGSPTAPVMIVEYTDYDCAYCRQFHMTLEQVIANRGANGKVSWVLRQFPLTELHQNAKKHAQAAECVAKTGGNDAFWKFSHALFANQPIDPKQYGTLALEAGAPTDAFQKCYVNAATEVDARIDGDRQNALDIGAAGTPYSLLIVKGRAPIVMDGAYPVDAVEFLIDQALGK